MATVHEPVTAGLYGFPRVSENPFIVVSVHIAIPSGVSVHSGGCFAMLARRRSGMTANTCLSHTQPVVLRRSVRRSAAVQGFGLKGAGFIGCAGPAAVQNGARKGRDGVALARWCRWSRTSLGRSGAAFCGLADVPQNTGTQQLLC